jgi:thiol-disulfide isomerase/thioredoxin
MLRVALRLVWTIMCLVLCVPSTGRTQPPALQPLAIKAALPAFDLPGVDGQRHRETEFAQARVLVLIFTCNHCPTAQAYEERIMALDADYRDRGVAIVAISPNDPLAVRLDELGYTEVGDSLEDMQHRARLRGFRFPYLFDGETQELSRRMGVLATPHVFVFDQARTLQYQGRIDDSDIGTVTSHDTRNAIEALLAGQPVPVATTRVFGCSTKWSDKRASARESLARWDQEPVDLVVADEAAFRELSANPTENYRLVNIWSVTCAPCITELPELVTIHRMYRKRHFELITVCLDGSEAEAQARKFLGEHHVSCRNLLNGTGSQDKLAEALDPKWQGPVPYTILVAPGGEVVARWADEIDPLAVKSEIVHHLGRTYASRRR